MSWFHLFKEQQDSNIHKFGRGVNTQLNPEEERLFLDASKSFESGDILDGYEQFLHSLINYTKFKSNKNIIIERLDNQLNFTLYQGIALIKGEITKQSFKATSSIVDAKKLHVAIKRRLIERNYQLTYAHFYQHDESISLKVYLDNTTMTPQKIFFPLREIALNADYEKEYLTSEFGDIAILDNTHIQHLKPSETEVKYQYMQQWLKSSDDAIKRFPSNDTTGMINFTYLNLLFSIDYLILPRQKMGQELTQKISEYFNSDDERLQENRNAELQSFCETLEKISYEEFAPQLYTTTNTFTPMERASHEEILPFIEDALNKIRWYKHNRYQGIIPTIYSYIAFYLQYNYGLHPSLHAILHVIIEVHYSEFFKALGYTPLYNAQEEHFDKRRIIKRIDEAIEPYNEQFKSLESFSHELNFDSLEEFSHSFYLHLKHLNYAEI